LKTPETKPPIIPQWKMLKHPVHALSFGFGSGLLPTAPGTWGTVATLPIWCAMLYWLQPMALWIFWGVLTLLSIYSAQYTSDALGVHDHKAIVCDEIVGYLLVLLCLPHTVLWLVLGFIAFRFFDIVKPWPIKWCDQHIPGGVGIVVDDLAAALFSLALLWVGCWASNIL
jgi:phosphatidylglycerophosphatase A